ncbi:MAG: sirohydrochlorin cobaltochelatase [Akkermansia sp.]
MSSPTKQTTLENRKERLLLIAFGTSQPHPMDSYTQMEKDMLVHYPAENVAWSYTSDTIREKLAGQGTIIPTIEENLHRLSELSLKNKSIHSLRVQSLHITAGEEFSQMERILVRYIEKHPQRFSHLFLGRPLLESERDRDETITAILEDCPKERKPDEAILLMGHGQKQGRGDLILADFAHTLAQHDPFAFFATLEGSKKIDNILTQLKESQIKTVWLAPFLFMIGHHVAKDLLGDALHPDSWFNRLKNEGFIVKFHLKGLGDNAAIRSIFIRHALESTDDLVPLSTRTLNL